MEYLKVWTSFREIISTLDDAEKGRLFDAMLLYAETGEEPETFAGNERFLWPVARQDIDRAYEKSETCRANGSKKKQKEAKESEPKQTEAKASLNNNINIKKYKNKEKEIDKEKEPDLFNQFWAAYPRHENKQAAMKAFEKAKVDEELLKTILTAIEKQKQSTQWQENGGQYIPHPATWLNGRRWEDEVKKATSTQKTVTAQQYTQRDYTGEDEYYMNKMIEEIRNGVDSA